MKCPKCQFENPEDSMFCGACGSSLEIEVICPNCGSKLPAGFKFCNKCGHNLSELPKAPPKDDSAPPGAMPTSATSDIQEAAPASETRAPEAQRRQLTVMFCDLVGSTELSAQLDPEDLREVVRSYQKTAADVIQNFDGYIAQYLGDGLLVYFGYPQAHEDDAHRAVRAALGIVEAMGTLNTRLESEYGIQLAVRLGIHTGPVVVGEMGWGGRHEQLALGETPNIAARLEDLAEPDTVVISVITKRLVEGAFVLKDLGSHRLKGVPKPIAAAQVLNPIVTQSDEEEVGTGVVTTLVGRDEEIGLLLRRWEQSKEGFGQVVLINGEAGIGKSALADVLREQALREGYTRATYRCSPYHTNSALYPVITHLQRLWRWERDDTPAKKLDKMEETLRKTSLPLKEVVPLFAALCSLPLPEGSYAPLGLTPQQEKQQTQDALAAWLLEEAERRPMLVVYEDLHWADPSTIENIGLLVDQVPTVPMLIVLIFRPEFAPPWPNRSHMTPITLNRLERPQVEAMITQLGGGKALPAEVVQHIVTRTDGVPLYVEELTKMLLESDLLREEEDHYALAGTLSGVAIPATLQDSLMARLDRLPMVREVAQLGAVLGREFAYEMLKALAAVEESTLQERLRQLVGAELLYQRGRPPRARYMFKHALIQDAAYASLLKRTRQQYHQQIAQMLEAEFLETVEAEPELVAHHYTEAGLNKEAVNYWLQAGKRAAQRSAHAEAINHLNRGIEVLMTVPDTVERARQELEMQITLGPVLMAVKGQSSPDTERTYVRARELCQQVGETPQLFPVLHGLWRFYMVRAHLQTTQELAEQVFTLAQRAQDTGLLLEANRMMGQTMYWLGEMVQARAYFEQGMAIYDPQQHRSHAFVYGQDPGVACRAFAAWPIWVLGYPDQSLQSIQEALTLARELTHPFSLAFALTVAATVHQFRREVRAVLERAEALMTLSSEKGFAFWMAHGKILRGWAITAEGEEVEGITEMRQGLFAYRATGAELERLYFLSLLADAYGEIGQPQEGVPMLLEALAIADKTEDHHWEAELHRLKGELLLMHQGKKNVGEAEECFRTALDTARHQQAKSLELRAAMSLARLWQRQGKQKEARQILADIYGWFNEGFDTPDLQEAKALLEEVA
jgi:class 3 adenylate cyclase/predicted ATPase